MEESRKKPIMIGVIVVCLVLAGVIFYKTRPVGPGSRRSEKEIWVKCNNPDCGAKEQMDKKDYVEYLKAHMNPMLTPFTPALVCEECGEKSVFRAVECEKCGAVFILDIGSGSDDYQDRCPECSYSRAEETKKARQGK